MERRNFDKPTRVAIGRTAAHSTHCGNEMFVRALLDNRGEKSDRMLCFACGTEHLYTTLLSQISSEIVRRADRALRESEYLRRQLDELGKSTPGKT